MKRVVTVLTLLVFCVYARENPFEPTQDAQSVGKTTAITDTRAFFVNQTMKLPSSARILKSVELHYQNLDGSIESKTVEIDKNIDWHDELILQKNEALTQQNLLPQVPIQVVKEENISKSFEFLKTLHVKVSENEILLKTEDKKIRDFLVTKPYKIVIDFEKEVSFTTKTFTLGFKPFENMVIGNHDGYYRVVIELDGQYLYTLTKTQEGFELKLK